MQTNAQARRRSRRGVEQPVGREKTDKQREARVGCDNGGCELITTGTNSCCSRTTTSTEDTPAIQIPATMQQLQVHSVCLAPSQDYPFYIIAKRYIHPAFQARDCDSRSNGTQPLTLLLLHSTSFHKEIYEPVLETLFGMTANGQFRIREAWAVDCPNHGESAALNSTLLSGPPYDEYCARDRWWLLYFSDASYI